MAPAISIREEEEEELRFGCGRRLCPEITAISHKFDLGSKREREKKEKDGSCSSNTEETSHVRSEQSALHAMDSTAIERTLGSARR